MGNTWKGFAILLLLVCFMITCTSGWSRRRRRRSPPPPPPPPWCPAGCSYGWCHGNIGHCHCSSGWYGSTCSHPRCSYGCYNGKCTYPNRCSCSQGWSGYTCRTPICSQGCSHGSCTYPNSCHCSNGWRGPACNIPVCLNGCNNGGTCVSPGRCVCRYPYTGPSCDIRLCKELEAPKNGTVECAIDYTINKQVCSISCNEGFNFSAIVRPEPLQVCEEDGMFTQQAANKEIPDCTEESPLDLATNLTMQVNFPAPCSEISTSDWNEIRKKGLEAVNYRLCGSTQGCGDLLLSLVNSSCGPKVDATEDRVAKSQPAYDNYDYGYNYGYHYQEQQPTDPTAKMALSLTFEVLTHTNVTGSALGTDDMSAFEQRLRDAFADTFEAAKKEPILVELRRLETILEISLEFVTHTNMKVKCTRKGQMLLVDTCLDCSCGTFYNKASLACEPCPIGTYQDKVGQTECKNCTEGLTTRLTGTKNRSGCQPLCPPGFISGNGFQPCQPCPSHRTQPRVGQTHCI